MYIDKENEFCNAMTATSDGASTNVIKAGKNIGAGNQVLIEILVTTAFAGGTGVEFKLQAATDEAFSSPVDIATTGAVVTAGLTAGKKMYLTVPSEHAEYIRIYHDVDGTFSAGAYSAFVVSTPQTNV